MRDRLRVIGRVLLAGRREIGVVASLALITAGLWPDLGVRALIPSGLIGLWLHLPPRPVFVVRPPLSQPQRKRA